MAHRATWSASRTGPAGDVHHDEHRAPGVGLQGIGLSERAYQNALKYSRERLQSRALSGAGFPDKPADPIWSTRMCDACC